MIHPSRAMHAAQPVTRPSTAERAIMWTSISTYTQCQAAAAIQSRRRYQSEYKQNSPDGRCGPRSSPHAPNADSARSIARANAAALFTVSWYSGSGLESATIPPAACR